MRRMHVYHGVAMFTCFVPVIRTTKQEKKRKCASSRVLLKGFVVRTGINFFFLQNIRSLRFQNFLLVWEVKNRPKLLQNSKLLKIKFQKKENILKTIRFITKGFRIS